MFVRNRKEYLNKKIIKLFFLDGQEKKILLRKINSFESQSKCKRKQLFQKIKRWFKETKIKKLKVFKCNKDDIILNIKHIIKP